MTTYPSELHEQFEQAIVAHPELSYRWEGDMLVFPSTSPTGFGIQIIAADDPGSIDAVQVYTDTGIHQFFDGSPHEAVEDALGLVRDLLSPDMRIRECCANGKPYRWILERRAADGWHRESIMGLFFWNWFGRRSERVYQNTQLPGRLHALPNSA